MSQIINLTPHAITFVRADGSELVVPASGNLARVSAKTETVGSLEALGLPITSTVYGEVEGLPEAKEGTIYIVSSIVASRVPERTDVFIPNESVRDSEGRIIGCKSLGRV